MTTYWVYNGPANKYPYIANYKNDVTTYYGASVKYMKSSSTNYDSNINYTRYQTEFEYTLPNDSHSFTWICGINFYMDGTYSTY